MRALTAALSLALLGWSCVSAAPEADEAFLRLPRTEWSTALASYPPERRVDLYIETMRAFHPPALEIVGALAAGGEEVVPAVLSRLRQEPRESVRVDLLLVLASMQTQNKAELRGDPARMAALEAAVAGMSERRWKEIAERHLAVIRQADPSVP